MGWTYTEMTKKQLVADLTKGTQNLKVVDYKVVGKELWTVFEEAVTSKRTIVLFLLDSQKGFGWGYKDMDESMGPYYYNCPLEFLQLAPVVNQNWRNQVIFHQGEQAAKKSAYKKLHIGQKVALAKGYKVGTLTIIGFKGRSALGQDESTGRIYRIPHNAIAV